MKTFSLLGWLMLGTLCCSRTLADIIESAWNDTKNSFENEVGSAWNKTKEYFEEEVAEKATEVLADSDLGPGIIAQIPMGYSRTPPIRASPKTSHIQSEVIVALYNNDTDEEYYWIQPPQFNHFQNLYDGWNDSWFGISLDSFDAEIEVDIDLSGHAEGDYTISLLTKSFEVDGVGVEVDFQLYMTAQASAEMSFTAGLELSLKKPAALMVPALDPVLDLKKGQLIGFDLDNLALNPIFNATMPQLDFSAMLALRTVFSVDVEGLDVGALTLDLPAFDLTVNTMQNMLADCKRPPPGTPPDKIYAELIHMGATLDAKLSYEALGNEFSGEIDSWQLWSGIDKCYAFLPGSGSIGPVPASSQDSILTEKPVTTCTTDGNPTIAMAVQSLTPRIKAGIAAGTIIGIFLIAAIAFYGGRASQRHSIRKHGVESMNNGIYFGVGGLRHRYHLPESKQDDFSSNTLIRYVSDEAPEPHMQKAHRTSPKRKPVPLITVNGTGMQSSTDRSRRGDDSASNLDLQEPGVVWNGTQLESTRCWGPGEVSGESQGLLRGQNRPSGRRR